MAYRYSSRTRWDLVWKEALTQFFQPAMEFLFPLVAADIDWSHRVEILDRELRTLLRDTRARRGKTRFVDHLVRTRRRSGEFEAMLVHLEIQVQPQVAFERRVYRYHSRLTAAHEELVATLVVLGDDDPNRRPTEYQRDYPGGGSAYLKASDFKAPRSGAILGGTLQKSQCLRPVRSGAPEGSPHAPPRGRSPQLEGAPDAHPRQQVV